MGALRTLFAIAVVFGHSFGYVFVGGQNAVQLFYMISGFLISYVLVECKAYPSMKIFYINRFLRIYPIYLFIALLTLFLLLLTPAIDNDVGFTEVYQSAPFFANLLLIISNAIVFFQDWVMFAGVENGHLVFSSNFYASEIKLWHGLLVPQAWSLGVEFTFYLFAPYILFNKSRMLSLLGISVFLRIILVHTGLGANDPWTYRFFPTELAVFLLGACSHQFLLPLYRRIFSQEKLNVFTKNATWALIIVTIIFSFIPISESIKSQIFFVLFFTLMPFAFIFSSRVQWDKLIGELSYPIYISHIFILHIIIYFYCDFLAIQVLNYHENVSQLAKFIISLITVILSILFSILLNRYIANPVDMIRKRFKKFGIA